MEVGIEEAINYFFSKPSFDLVFFEAIANSLDADSSEIKITINLPTFSDPTGLKLTIRDNGIGFTEKNFQQFSTLLKHKDSQHKGLGRLIYLHYFNQVAITSSFDGTVREFIFNKDFKGDSEVTKVNETQKRETVLVFSGFSNDRLKTYDNVRCSTVRQHILETFLPRLYHMHQKGMHFCISVETITDENNDKYSFYSDTAIITNDDLPIMREKIIDCSDLSIFEDKLELLYFINTEVPGKIVTEICVDGRGVEIQLLQKKTIPESISGLFFLQSSFFDSKASDSRQDIVLDEYEEQIIKQKFLKAIGEILNEEFPKIREDNRLTVERLSNQFPHLEGYFEEETVGLLEENQTLEHAQSVFFKEQKEVLRAEKLSDEQYQKSIIQATRTLAEYILYRNIIIKKLREIKGSDKESTIHNLIIPMRSEHSSDDPFLDRLYSNNAWLVDDKFMGYHYALSDESMNKLLEKIAGDKEAHTSGELRPDIAMVFSDNIESCKHPVDVVVVELKKKELGYLGNTVVVSQLHQRARRLLAYYGSKIQRMWFIGIVDFDVEFKTELRESWHQLYSTGEIYCKSEELFPVDKNLNPIGEKKYPVNMMLMSFDALWKDAETRNKEFLEVLRHSIKSG